MRGRLTDQPAPVVFLAPASRCEPIEGQPYDRVPTTRHDATPDWNIEEPVYFTGNVGPARIVHRGNCHAIRDVSNAATTDQARAALERPDGAPFSVCRPDRVLSSRS